MNKLQTEAMDRNTECAPMAPEFRVLPDLGGAAVRAACTHDEAITQYTGDGSPVSYCPDCGRNEPMDGAAVRALPSDLTEREEIDLLCQVERYMSITDKHSQTHPAAGAEEARIYSLVNSLIAKRFSDIGAAVRGEAVAREYFYKVDACKADDGKSPECICWHKEGTGPLASCPHEVKNWRPAAPVSARAADAPSEPSEVPEGFNEHEKLIWRLGRAAGRGESKSRAADALDSQPTEPTAEVRARVRDAVWEQIKGNYYCGRVWDAWQVGTMTKDDFEPSEDNDEVLDNITDAVIAALSSQPTDGGVRNDSEPGRDDEDWFFSPNDGN